MRIRRIWQEPDAETSVDAMAALLGADLIVIGPGDLYTSVLSGLIVGGVADAVRARRARRLYVCNLMTKPGETFGYDVADHVGAVVQALGADALDYVLLSSSPLSAEAVDTYAGRSQHPVVPSTSARLRAVTRAEVLTGDIGHRAELVRHDGSKLGDSLLAVLDELARTAEKVPRRPLRGRPLALRGLFPGPHELAHESAKHGKVRPSAIGRRR